MGEPVGFWPVLSTRALKAFIVPLPDFLENAPGPKGRPTGAIETCQRSPPGRNANVPRAMGCPNEVARTDQLLTRIDILPN